MRLDVLHIAPRIYLPAPVYVTKSDGDIYLSGKSISSCMNMAHDIGYEIVTDVRIML